MGALVPALLLLLSGCPDRSERPSPGERLTEQPKACTDGLSEDPSRAELRAGLDLFERGAYREAQAEFSRLLREYPRSATTAALHGDATLFDKALDYNDAARRALEHYRRSLSLHEHGCRLSDERLYYLLMGMAYAHLRNDEADAALVHLDAAAREFPNSAEVHYHRARCFCQKHDVEHCFSEFEQAIHLAEALERPLFLRTHTTVDDWLRRSEDQSEFEPLRRDARYKKLQTERSRALLGPTGNP